MQEPDEGQHLNRYRDQVDQEESPVGGDARHHDQPAIVAIGQPATRRLGEHVAYQRGSADHSDEKGRATAVLDEERQDREEDPQADGVEGIAGEEDPGRPADPAEAEAGADPEHDS